jgi:hypothetical protein
MTFIRTVENDRLSLFMAMVDDLLLRRGEVQGRPDLRHPMVLAATVFAEKKQAGEAISDAPPREVSDRLGSDAATVWRCVRLAGELWLARIEHDEAKAQAFEKALKDSECDPEWLEAITAYLGYFGPDGKKSAIPYVPPRRRDDPASVFQTLAPDAILALVGDWGTGTERAVALLEQVTRHKPDVVLHLGDVYYAGTEREMRANFLDICDRVLDRSNTRIRIYAIPGNHEMYSGGAAYYALLAKLNAPPLFPAQDTQVASYFCLRTTDGAWQLLGMDTGYHDHDPFEVAGGMTFLEPAELAWHLDKIERFHAAGGRTVLLSHHQLFSAFAGIGKQDGKPAGREAFNTKLLAAFRDVLAQGKVSAWFWGHEHNLAIYEPYPPLDKGRCIGHGGVPVFTSQEPYKVLPSLPNPPRLVRDPSTGGEVVLGTDAQGVFDVGYVILRLRAGEAEAKYYTLQGGDTPLYREILA